MRSTLKYLALGLGLTALGQVQAKGLTANADCLKNFADSASLETLRTALGESDSSSSQTSAGFMMTLSKNLISDSLRDQLVQKIAEQTDDELPALMALDDLQLRVASVFIVTDLYVYESSHRWKTAADCSTKTADVKNYEAQLPSAQSFSAYFESHRADARMWPTFKALMDGDGATPANQKAILTYVMKMILRGPAAK